MNKTPEQYSEEFGDYILIRNKSKNTVDIYRRVVRKLLETINKDPNEINYNDIVSYVHSINQKDYNPNAKKSMYSAIKRYLRYIKNTYHNNTYDDWLKEKEETDNVKDDIFYVNKAKVKRKDTLTVDEIKKLFKVSESNIRDYAILKTFFYTSQRGGSIENLNIEHIDMVGKVNPKDGKRYHKILIQSAKGDSDYYIEVEHECIEAIKQYLDSDIREKPKDGFRKNNYGRPIYHKDAVFLNGNGERLTSQAMRRMMKKYAMLSGIGKNVYNHLWRTSTITLMDKAGMSLAEIMEKTGHSNLQSVRPYLNPKADDVNTKHSQALSLDGVIQAKPMDTKDREIEELKAKLKELERQTSYIG